MLGLTLRQVRAFLVTVELGSVAAAAKKLGLSQPAVGQQLREFEGQLRLRLFEKVGTRLLPTVAGTALVQPARELLAAVGRLYDAGAPYRDDGTGHIRLGTGATACIHLLPQPLLRTRQALPGLEITVVTGSTAEMVQALQDGQLDLAVVTAAPSEMPRSLEAELLFEEELVALVPASSQAVPPEPLSAAALAAQPLILHARSATRRLVDDWFHRAGQVPTPVMDLDSIEAIKQLAAIGLGCSIIPASAAEALPLGLQRRRLEPVLRRPVTLVLRGAKVADAALRALLVELRADAKRRS